MRWWRHNQWIWRLRELFQRYYLPLLLGFIATIVVLSLWQHLLKYEQLHLHQLVQQEASALETELSQELSTRILALEQMANRWQNSGGTPKAAWEADALQYIEDFGGYQAIEWVDPSFRVRWIVPTEGNKAAENFDLSKESRRQITLSVARDLHQTLLTRTITLAQGGKGMLAVVPLFTKDRADIPTTNHFDGFIVAAFRFQQLFDSILTTSPHYQVQIFDHSSLIYSQGKDKTTEQPGIGEVQTYGADWQIQVFPTPEFVTAGRSLLPEVVLWGGLAIVWTLALTMSLKQKATRQVQQIRKINQQLQDEMIYRQQVEADLRQSEERWQLALRGNNDGIWDWNVKTNEVFFSKQWQEMLGFEEGEIPNHFEEWSKRIHPNDLEWVTAAVFDHFSQKTPFYIAEYRVQCKDGSYKWVLARGQALWDGAGNVVRMVGSHTDTTERKQAEIALQESEARYQQLVSHMNAGFVVHAPDTHILQCNTAACDLLGLSRDQVFGKAAIDPAWHFIREDGTSMPVEEYPVNLVLSTQTPLNHYVLGINREDKSRVWVMVTAFPELDANQQIKQVIVTFIDISQLKQVERNLQEMTVALEKELLRSKTLFNTSIDGIVVLNHQGNVVQTSPRFAQMLGYTLEETLKLNVADWDAQWTPEELQEIIEKDILPPIFETRHRRKDGSLYDTEVSYSRFQLDGETIHFLICRDISDRKQSEQALRESEEKFRQLIDNIHQVFFILSAQGEMLYISPAYEQVWQRSCDSLYAAPRSWLDSVYVEDLSRITLALHKQISEGQPFNEVYRITHPNGEIRWISAQSFPLKNESGQVIRFTGIAEDITQQKQSEGALRQSEATKQAIIQAIPDLLIQMRSNGDYVEFISNSGFNIINPAQTRQEVNIYDVLPANLAQLRMHHIQRALAANQTQIYEQEIVIEGQQHYEEVRIVPLLQDEVLVMVRDITDRKQSEIDLKNSQARFAGILEIASDAIIAVNVKQQITLFNKGAERIFGYTAEEILGQPLTLLMPDRFAQAHRHHVDQYTHDDSQTRPMSQRGAIFGRRKDGTEFPAEASISKLNLNGEITFTTFLRDISERVRLEAEHQQAEEVLRQSEEKFRMAIDFTYNWEYWQAPDGSFIYVSPSCERITGYTPAEFIQNPHLIQTIIHPDDASILTHHACDDQFETGAIEFRIITRDNEIRWIAHVCQPVFNHAGEYLGKRASNRDISERIQLEAERQHSEEAMRQSEATKQAIIQAIPDLLMRMHSDGSAVEFISNSHFNIINSAQVGQGATVFDVLPSHLAQLRMHYSQLALESKNTQIYEQEVVLEGERRYEEVRIVPLQQDEVLVMVRDITDRKQSEIALQLSQEQLQLALEASGDGLWDWNITTGEVYYSPQYMEMLGYAADELPQNFETWNYLTHPDDRPWILDILNDNLRGSSWQYSFDYRVRAKSGVWKWIANYGKVVARDAQGHPLRMIGTHRDISDRKQAETDLLHQKEMFQAIVDHIPVMIALFDDNGHIEFANPELEHVLGWSLEEWQHQDVLAFCYPDAVYRQSIKDFMLAATGRWQDMITLTASGQTLETTWANVRLSSGRFLGIGQDISDRKRKETALKQAMEAAEAANLAKSMFLANMSHELRTPLNVILGFTQVMAHDQSLTPSQQDDLQTIRRSGDYLLSLINNVLDLSKIESGHASLEESGFDLISLLHTLRTMMAERAKTKQLQLTFDIAPEVPQFVIADEQKLRQILLNLLSNAIKFTNQGSVRLQAKVNDQQNAVKDGNQPLLPPYLYSFNSQASNFVYLRFEIADTGVGIAENEQEAIFDAFVQAEAGRKSVSGTGLGLTISRKLVELMHGTISMQSIPNVGSTFTVNIPVYSVSGINVQAKQSNRTIIGLVPGHHHHRILIVDDQRENRLLMVRLLTQLGLEVREATNGQEAIQLWQEWQPDLTWMDIRMPGIDGYEATRQIRAMEQDKASVIIALTAQASQSDRALALAAGCNDYISKPFREETLFLKLKEYLGLEFLYADPEPPSSHPPRQPFNLDAENLISFDSNMLTQLPSGWLDTLEDLAICGNDRAIIDLANQLAPEFEAFKVYLVNLASQFEFEQIIQLIHLDPSS